MGVDGVRRIKLTGREKPVFGGTEFGAVGPYERLHGTLFGELDTHPLNVGSSTSIRSHATRRVTSSIRATSGS